MTNTSPRPKPCRHFLGNWWVPGQHHLPQRAQAPFTICRLQHYRWPVEAEHGLLRLMYVDDCWCPSRVYTDPTPEHRMKLNRTLVPVDRVPSRRVQGRYPSANTNISDPLSETISVSSSLFDFVYLNGRRYQSNCFKHADYSMPNDEGEQDRLDLFHHMFLLLLGGKLYSTPLENPQNVLDVGTGTGIWAIDFAE